MQCIIINDTISFTYGLVVTDLSFSMEIQVQFLLVSYWGGYWAMMVTNPPRGVQS
ncbi:hypothetical protein Hanom_Chr14g01311611 [Helianthus anomalus]